MSLMGICTSFISRESPNIALSNKIVKSCMNRCFFRHVSSIQRPLLIAKIPSQITSCWINKKKKIAKSHSISFISFAPYSAIWIGWILLICWKDLLSVNLRVTVWKSYLRKLGKIDSPRLLKFCIELVVTRHRPYHHTWKRAVYQFVGSIDYNLMPYTCQFE